MGYQSEMSRAVRSLDTVKRSKELLPSFYARSEKRREPGTVLAWCMAGVPPELLAAFDISWDWPENFGTLCASKLVATKFIEVAETEGYSNDLCSYLNNTMGYLKRCQEVGGVPPESPSRDGMGYPQMLLGSGLVCEPRWKWFQAIATRYLKIPVYTADPLSPPYDVDISNPKIAAHYLTQLRADLKGQVTFLEAQTGKKLDPDHLREILKYSQEAIRLWDAVLELRKAVPCPMGAPDYFSCIIPQMYMLGSEEAVNFFRQLYNEVKSRVDKGVGVIANEKYRLAWFGLPPWFNLGLFNYMESLGAVFVAESTYRVSPFIELDLSNPLEAMVQRTWQRAAWRHKKGTEAMPEICNQAAFGAIVGGSTMREWARDYRLDGAVMQRTRSCRALSLGHIHAKNELLKASVPSLIFISDMADPRAWSDERVKSQVEAFLETVADAKKTRTF
jgi:benzoyl-CoA reductase/2-hydroxyglutaryl-CoA dehydratase subunit BcrC/BadD/HgdB